METTEDKGQRINFGEIPSHAATFNGHLDVCKYIKETTNDKSPRCNCGGLPLRFAPTNGHLDVCKYIIENN